MDIDAAADEQDVEDIDLDISIDIDIESGTCYSSSSLTRSFTTNTLIISNRSRNYSTSSISSMECAGISSSLIQSYDLTSKHYHIIISMNKL